MTLGERIEERLKVLSLSQAELARRANVPQTTMNSLVRGKARTTPHLIRIARELRTTPAYLMGETDNPRAEFHTLDLTNAEMEWIKTIRRLEPKDRSSLLQIARRLAQLEKPTTERAELELPSDVSVSIDPNDINQSDKAFAHAPRLSNLSKSKR